MNMLPVIPKRFLDFSTLPNGSTNEFVLADRVQLLHWRELTLTVNVHSHTLTGTNTINIFVYPQSWTEEDPAKLFLAPIAGPTLTLTAFSPSPGLLTVPIQTLGQQPAIAAMARITAGGVRAASGGTMQATLSLRFSTKEA
jgi:hypothetical protein